jgi:hypothetical protein
MFVPRLAFAMIVTYYLVFAAPAMRKLEKLVRYCGPATERLRRACVTGSRKANGSAAARVAGSLAELLTARAPRLRKAQAAHRDGEAASAGWRPTPLENCNGWRQSRVADPVCSHLAVAKSARSAMVSAWGSEFAFALA